MRKRPLYLLAVLLLIVANGIDLMAKRFAGDAAVYAARATAAELDDDRQQLRKESRQSLSQHHQIATLGLGVLLAGVFLWIGSGLRKEPGIQSIPLVLMISAVIFQLLLV